LALSATTSVRWVANPLSSFVGVADHCGIGNLTLIATKHPLALEWDNKAPLENHSVKLCLQLLERDELNVLRNLSKEEAATARDIIKDVILATDITNGEHTRALHAEWDRCAARFRASKPEHQNSLARMVLLCADVGIVQEEWQTFVAWVQRLFDENHLVDEKISPATFYPGQLKFLDGYAKPLFEAMHRSGLLQFDAVVERFRSNAARMKESNPITETKAAAKAAGAGGGSRAAAAAAAAATAASSAGSGASAESKSAGSQAAGSEGASAGRDAAAQNGAGIQREASTERKRTRTRPAAGGSS
jgi:hypothetical protein